MRRILRFLSRISIRLMAFNLLLVFLPVAAVLYLDLYERELVAAQERSMAAQGRILAAALSQTGQLDAARARTILQQLSRQQASGSPPAEEMHLRVVGPGGNVLADSFEWSEAARTPPRQENVIRRNWLYRLGSFVLRPILRLIRPPIRPLERNDAYERSNWLMGPEVQSALRGRYGFTKRISSRGERAITLYTALPVFSGQDAVGAVLVSESTYAVLRDIYPIRLGVVRIFFASIILAVVISLMVGTTIVGPLRQLRREAGAILDRRGRLKGRFQGSDKLDEIGDLSRTLERVTRRLDGHVRFIETFAADVSHEFKNPLASVRSATEMLNEVEEPAERRRFLRIVQHDIARMEHLLSGVRAITLIDAQLSKEPREQVDVKELIERITEGFGAREGARLHLEVESQPAFVEASKERLIQVVENVIENAVSFSPPGGTIQVELSQGQGTVLLRVSDEGPGIPQSHLDRIFDRFFSYRPDAAGKGTHTGLGLAIVKTIVEGYGGSISAANRSSGGAVFEVRLPGTKS